MGDDITIGVTEIVNNIEVTAQPNDQIIELSVVDNADDVTLNITPTVIEINVNKGSSYAKWGTILGTLSDQEDLQDALDLKADLVDGKVPSSQLPSYVDDVIEVADYESLPTTGESGKIYITLDTNRIYRWTGSTYVEITDNTAVWGAITGTLSSQTDLQSALNAKQALLSGTGIVKSTSGTISYLTDNSNNWNTAYNDKINSASVTGTTTKTLTLNQQDGGTVTASWTDDNTDSVSSVFGRTGAVVAASGDYTTTQVTEGTNLYYTESRVNANTNVAANTAARHNAVTIGTANGLSLSTQALSLGLASSSSNGALSSTDWTTFNNKLSSLSGAVLTTTNQNIGGYKTFTEGAIILNNASNNLIDFQISGESVGNISLGSSYTQFTSKASNGYLFKNSVSNNSLAISDSGNGTFLGSITATSIIKSGGTSSQFLKADGSVDSSVYHTGSLTTNYLPKATGATTLGNSLIYDNGTNVGIGTTSPSAKLSVSGNIESRTTTSASTTSYIRIGTYDVNGAWGSFIRTDSNYSGSLDTNLILGTSSGGSPLNALTILSGGNVGIGTTSPARPLTIRSAHATASSTTYTGALLIHDEPSGVSPHLGMGVAYNNGNQHSWIQSNNTDGYYSLCLNPAGGNVGIGTTVPSTLLHLNAGALFDTNIRVQSGAAGNHAKLTFSNSSNTVFWTAGYRSGTGDFGINYGDSFNSTGLTITPLGNVGIGTTSPAAKLEVQVAQDVSGYSLSGFPFLKYSNGDQLDFGGYGSTWQTLKFHTAGSERMRIRANGIINIDAMPYYTNNAAALAGGLTYGDLYYSTDASSATVKIVINFG